MSVSQRQKWATEAKLRLRADGSSDKPYTSSIRSSATEGTQADVINIDGSASAEDVDVIVRGGGPFTASPRKTGEGEAAAYTQVVIMASRDLTIADEGMHNIVITINGRALPTRTAQAYARIRITASNPAPTSVYDADNPLVVEIAETDDELGNLIDADDDLKTDLADYVTDDSDASGLRYTVVGTTVFDTDGSKLIVTGDVSDSGKSPAPVRRRTTRIQLTSMKASLRVRARRMAVSSAQTELWPKLRTSLATSPTNSA